MIFGRNKELGGWTDTQHPVFHLFVHMWAQVFLKGYYAYTLQVHGSCRLEYCCPLWNPADITSIKAIESVQQHSTKRISGLQHLSYHDQQKGLQLQSLQRRRESFIIIYMWKIRHSLSPNDPQISFSENNLQWPLAVIPRLRSSSWAKFQTLYDNSFAVVGPKLWNILPAKLRSLPWYSSNTGLH